MRIRHASLLMAAVAASQSIVNAGVTTILDDTATQYTILENANTTGVPTSSLVGNTSGGNYRVGAASGNVGSRNPVYSFKLPVATAGEAVISVQASFGVANYVQPAYASGTLDFNGDLYVLGTPVSGTSNRIVRFNETDSSENAASIKIQDNLLTPTAATNFTASTSSSASTALGSYLADFYASAIGQGYDGSQPRYLSLRINPDADLGGAGGLPTLGNPTNNNGYNVVPANPTAASGLAPVIPKIVITTAKDWVSTGADLWSNPAAWSPTGAPTATNSIRFGNKVTANTAITIDSGGVVASTLVDTTFRYTVALAPGGPTSFNAGALNLQAGTLAIAAGKTNTLRASSLTIAAAGATLDLADNKAIVDYSATSPIQSVRTALQAGTIVGTNTATTAIGYGESAVVLKPGVTTFGGETVAGTAVLLSYTLKGDATLDGIVNFDDLVPLAQNYNQTATRVWTDGDFTYDGTVNFDDLVPLAQNYNKTIAGNLVGDASTFAADWALAQSLVPEPAALALVPLATIALRRRRNA